MSEVNGMEFVDIGFGNRVNTRRIVSVLSPDSLPIRRLVQDSKNAGRVIDCSCGKKTRSVIVTDSDHVILSSLQPETVANRLNDSYDEDEEDE